MIYIESKQELPEKVRKLAPFQYDRRQDEFTCSLSLKDDFGDYDIDEVYRAVNNWWCEIRAFPSLKTGEFNPRFPNNYKIFNRILGCKASNEILMIDYCMCYEDKVYLRVRISQSDEFEARANMLNSKFKDIDLARDIKLNPVGYRLVPRIEMTTVKVGKKIFKHMTLLCFDLYLDPYHMTEFAHKYFDCMNY